MRVPTPRHLQWLVLLVSAALRVVLVWSGGQYYWPDEDRYQEAHAIVQSLARGDVGAVFARLDGTSHQLFEVVALVPATAEFMFGEDARLPGVFFAAFSVCNIWLIGRLAARLGASDREALLATLLLAMSSSFFYFARHLLPYDLSMTLALVAITVAVRSASYRRGACGAGVLAAAAFLAYNGYWPIASMALLANAGMWAVTWRDAIRRVLVSGACFVAAVGAVVATSAAFGGRLLQNALRSADSIRQGSFEEGWRLPFEYLWHAEHGLLVVWLASMGLCLVAARSAFALPRVRIGVLGLAVVYTALAISSTLLHVFVVYGRLARQLVPFFCLVAAYGLTRLWGARRGVARAAVPVVLALLVVQTGVHFAQPLGQTFPDDLERRYGPSRTSRFIWVNVEHIYPEPRKVVLPERYALFRRAPHPLEFLPYQYEGYTPAQRRVLRSTDISMRLIGGLP
jgi:hypothetical protein